MDAYVASNIYHENKHARQRFINQIEAWFANRFLRKATSFLVHIYASQYDGTCTISHTEKELENDTSPDFDPFIHEAPDIKVSEWDWSALGPGGNHATTEHDVTKISCKFQVLQRPSQND